MTDQQKTKTFIQRNSWIIIPAILIMGSVFVFNIVDIDAKTESQKWKPTDFNTLVDQCMKNTGDLGVKYPKVTRDYCECATKKIQAAISKQLYAETMDKEPAEQLKIINPIIRDCVDAYQDTIKVLIDK